MNTTPYFTPTTQKVLLGSAAAFGYTAMLSLVATVVLSGIVKWGHFSPLIRGKLHHALIGTAASTIGCIALSILFYRLKEIKMQSHDPLLP